MDTILSFFRFGGIFDTSNTQEVKLPAADETPNYYEWQNIYPELEVLKSRYQDILEEARRVPQWTPWPEG